PHVSLSEGLASAFASYGSPPDTPSGWHLLLLQWESTYQVTPFPVAMLRIRRAVCSTGVLWQCMVAYLQLADIVSSPLPCRRNDTNQPMISTPTVFSTPRSTLVVCI